ncbi:histidine kinase [Planktothricoides sp. SR001]|uniref:ATP-binding protein n=1 Tax=Planktothricoides sp. SR001 TaxID=1705388 RepID=UPI0006BEC82D|nr:ATP-binding protein [Planktothricoides sp. SR001]KOR34092.1 histidine kinase [Planktothricoides sp. SR001]
MFKPGRSSFRRILLTRILLLSIPVLLMGEYTTYRKARSALLETARQNLTESAIRKGQSIETSVKALEASLLTATEATVLQSEETAAIAQYLQTLDERLPTKVQCTQLTDIATNRIIASTCGSAPIYRQLPLDKWQNPSPDSSLVDVSLQLSENQPSSSEERQRNMRMVFSAPVFPGNVVSGGNIRYALSLLSTLEQETVGKRGSLTGQTVVIDVFDTTYQQENGTIVEHLSPDRAGTNIAEEADADRLRSIVRNAISGKQDFVHLFDFEAPGIELISGYTAIASPVSPDKRWIILAVTRLDNALAGLKEIQKVLFTLIFSLIAANLVVTWYLTLELARPIEQLQAYALNVHRRQTEGDTGPIKLKITEFQQLADALDTMVERLKAWATELESAWQEAKVANQLKNEFLATISHELRTPLNAIIGCIRLVRDDCCDDREEEVEFLQRADDAAIHLLNIINDILDISKIEAGTLSVTLEPVDVSRIIKEVIEIQENAIAQKGLHLSVQEYPEPLVVEADPSKLKQVLLNLMNNCIKFTDTGSITISTRLESSYTEVMNRVSTTTETLDGSGKGATDVVITLKDTGIGIALEQQQKLFQPFVMVDGSTTRRHGGTGLGLAIARNLIELMGGTIMLNSKGVGQGTTVEVALPKANLLPSSALKNPSVGANSL